MQKTQRIRTTTKNEELRAMSLFKVLCTAAACMISSASQLIGFLSPMNVAIVAFSSTTASIAGFGMSVITYLLTGNFARGLVQICSMAVIIAYKMMKSEDEEKNSIFMSLLTFGVMAIFGIGLGVLFGENGYEIAFRITSAMICAVTIFFASTAQTALKTLGSVAITEKGGASIGVLYVLAIATLTSVNIFSINLGRTVGIVMLLLSAKRFRLTGGAIVGALTSCGVILCSSSLAANTALLATAGMLCGICAGLGTFMITVVFMIVNLVGLITVGINLDTAHILYDAMCASIIFLIIPQNLATRFSQLIGIGTATEPSGVNTASRLIFASKSIQEIKSQLNRVVGIVEKKTASESCPDMVCKNVCALCPHRNSCWTDRFDEINEGFEKLNRIIEQKGKLEFSDVSDKLSWCSFKSTIQSEFNSSFTNINYEKVMAKKNSYAKEIIIEQLSVMEYILDDLGADCALSYIPQKSKTSQLRKYLHKLGYTNYKACVYCDEQGNSMVEMYLPKDCDLDEVVLCADISEIVESELTLPVITTVRNLKKLVFGVKMPYEMTYHTYSITGTKSEISGDTVQACDLSPYESVLIMSDGMGTGRQAQLDSMMSVNFALRLLRAGLRPATAMRLLNTLLTVKGWDESFATMDIASFNKKTGRIEFIKAGAAATYIIRKGEVKKIGGESFPLGILSEFYPCSQSFALKSGDVVLMMTDGITDKLASKLIEAVQMVKNPEAGSLVSMLGSLCTDESGMLHDDISLAALVINEKSTDKSKFLLL